MIVKRGKAGSRCLLPYVALVHQGPLHTQLVLLQGLPLSLADVMEILDVELQAQEFALQVVHFSVSLPGLGSQKNKSIS